MRKTRLRVTHLAAAMLLLIPTVVSAEVGVVDPNRDAATVPTTQAQVVGEDVHEAYSSPNPYPGVSGDGVAELIWSDVLHYPQATYICPHFSRMDLGEGDYVIVRSPDGSRSWRYEGAGKADLGLSAEGFWGIHIAGDTAIIELWSAGEGGGFGYTIDRYARGFTREEFGEPDAIDGIIGVDDSEWAPCYETSDPVIYDRSRAVARLLITGTFACSGWLLGNEGHLMTNQHCIENQSQAWNTNYEFMAEGASCATNCGWWFACPGTIVSTTATMIGFSADYDYALVELPVNPTQAYGYFVLRETGGVVNERLYMPQHPQGWGKKVALYSSEPNDPGWPKVVTKNAGGCQGRPGPDMAYRADTQGGTSGSPVLGYSDNKVIALHHCGGSTFNTGVLIEQVIAGLGSDLPSTAFGVEGLIFENGFEVGGTLFWSNTVP